VRTYCHPKYYTGLPNQLYHNNGDGTFTDVSQASGIADHIGKGMGLAFLDFDGDGRLDVLLIETEYPNQVTAYHETSGSWAYWGRMDGARCPGALEALRIGRFDLAPASTRDVIANGHRLHLTPGCRRER